MPRNLKIVVVTLTLVIVSGITFGAVGSARPTLAAQSAPTCQDLNLITEIGKDFNGLGPAFKSIDPTAADSTASVILQLASARQKYEDLQTPPECLAVQIQVIVTLANASDLASLVLASQVDKKTDPQVYKDAIAAQSKRFAAQGTALGKFMTAGMETPPATEAAQ